MIKDKVLLICKNKRFCVGYDLGAVRPGDEQHKYLILKELDSPNDARIYAAGMIDGLNLAVSPKGGECPEPIDPNEIRTCQSFIDITKHE